MYINCYYSKLVDMLDVWITKIMDSITSSKYVKLDCNTKDKINLTYLTLHLGGGGRY